LSLAPWLSLLPRFLLSASLLVRIPFCSPSASGSFHRRGSYCHRRCRCEPHLQFSRLYGVELANEESVFAITCSVCGLGSLVSSTLGACWTRQDPCALLPPRSKSDTCIEYHSLRLVSVKRTTAFKVPSYGGGLFLVITAFCPVTAWQPQFDRPSATAPVLSPRHPSAVVPRPSLALPFLQYQHASLLLLNEAEHLLMLPSLALLGFIFSPPKIELFNGRVLAGLDSITGRPSSPLASLQPIEWFSKPVRETTTIQLCHSLTLPSWTRWE
jgi:hypothetical protein